MWLGWLIIDFGQVLILWLVWLLLMLKTVYGLVVMLVNYW